MEFFRIKMNDEVALQKTDISPKKTNYSFWTVHYFQWKSIDWTLIRIHGWYFSYISIWKQVYGFWLCKRRCCCCCCFLCMFVSHWWKIVLTISVAIKRAKLSSNLIIFVPTERERERPNRQRKIITKRREEKKFPLFTKLKLKQNMNRDHFCFLYFVYTNKIIKSCVFFLKPPFVK